MKDSLARRSEPSCERTRSDFSPRTCPRVDALSRDCSAFRPEGAVPERCIRPRTPLIVRTKTLIKCGGRNATMRNNRLARARQDGAAIGDDGFEGVRPRARSKEG